jgi:hypothetical protein
MTPNPSPIEVLKQRAREEFENRFVEVLPEGSLWKKRSNPDDAPAFLDALIDEVIATVEREVVPEQADLDPNHQWPEGYNSARTAVLQAFRTLKGEEK